jgi:quinol monooxygenase YgiN
MSDPAVILIADLHGLVGLEAPLREQLETLARGARGEPGCVSFRVLADDEPGEWVLVSSWVDVAALRSHYATVHYRRYRQEIGPLLARPSDVVVHHVSATLHPLDPNEPDPGLFG